MPIIMTKQCCFWRINTWGTSPERYYPSSLSVVMPLLVMSKAAVFVLQQCMLTQGWVRIVFPFLPSVKLENSQLQLKTKALKKRRKWTWVNYCKQKLHVRSHPFQTQVVSASTDLLQVIWFKLWIWCLSYSPLSLPRFSLCKQFYIWSGFKSQSLKTQIEN